MLLLLCFYVVKNETTRTDMDLVLPCYNPPFGWERKVINDIRHIQSFFRHIRFHPYIVTDGSTTGFEQDKIATLKESLPGIRLIDYRPNRGKGYALREAIRHCQSEYMIYTDYDFPYTDQSFKRVVEALLDKADVVVAIRDKNYQKSLPPRRKLLSHLSHIYNSLFLGLKVKDTQGGLKGFNKTGQQIFLSTKVNGFLFDTEFIYKAQQSKADIRGIRGKIKEGIMISNIGLNTLKREAMYLFSILTGK